MRRCRLGIFLVGTFVLTWAGWGAMALDPGGRLALGRPGAAVLILLVALAPLIAGYAAVLAGGGWTAAGELSRDVIRWRLAPVWYAAVLLPIVLGYAARVAARLHGDPLALGPQHWLALLEVFPGLLVLGGALGEPGWRGVGLTELRKRFGLMASSWLLAGWWLACQAPLLVLQDTRPLETVVFATGIVGLTFALDWLYERAASTLPCILFHAAATAACTVGPIYLLFRGLSASWWEEPIAATLLALTGLGLVLFFPGVQRRVRATAGPER